MATNKITLNAIEIRRVDDTTVFITDKDGEGGSFDLKDFEEWVLKYFYENF